MLRASRQILKAGGVIVFAVIAPAENLGDRDLEEAIEAGPPFVAAGPGYSRLMTAAGFVDVQVTDITADYLTTATAWVDEWEAEAADLMAIIGAATFADQQANRRRAIAAVRRGLLRRLLVEARK